MENPKLTKKAYWAAVKKHNLIPNFWMSEEYISKAGLVWVNTGGLCGWVLPAQQSGAWEWFFPPMTKKGFFVGDGSHSVYAGFLENIVLDDNVKFLDYQFIYDPKDFLNLEGPQWGVFRKNIKKYPKRSNAELIYRKIDSENTQDSDSIKLLLNWAGEKEFFDNEVMIKYIVQGLHRWGLFADEKLVGMNVFDENWMFTNFRYCVDDGTPFLNEYMRYLFYTNDIIIMRNKLVSDGGSLDNEGLRRFKMKLNPCEIYVVTSYKQEKSNENQS